MTVIEKLKDEYGYNQPLILSELKIDGISDENLRQIFSRMSRKGNVKRYDQGIYYFPKQTPFGESTLSSERVYTRKYISDGSNIYGFYTGTKLFNNLALSTQMPNTIEIITNKEKSRLREVAIGNQKVKLRSSRVEINKDNVDILQFLELMNLLDISEIKADKSKLQIVKNFAIQKNIKKGRLLKYINQYPAKVAKNLLESGVLDELT